MAEKDPAQELKNALQQAKTKRMRFAFIHKGSTGTLLVCPETKAIPKDKIAEAREGGGKVYTGFCSGPPEAMVFKAKMAGDPAPTLGEAIKKAANNLGAGVLLKKAPQVVRMAPGEAKELDATDAPAPGVAAAGAAAPAAAAEAPASQAPATTASAPSAGPQASADPKADVTKRLKALTGPFMEAATQKGPEGEHMKSLMASFKGFVSKHDYEQAAKVLDELEPLVEQFKTRQADYKVRKGEVQAAVITVAGWGKDAGKYKTAIQAADKLEKTNVAEALANLDQAKSEAEADVKSAHDEYEDLKKIVMSKAEQVRDPKLWDQVKVDLEALPKPEDADAQVQAGKGAAGRKILEGLVAPYSLAEVHVQAYKNLLAKRDETNQKIAGLEKDASMAAHLAPQITDAKSKVEAALKLADPPGRDFAGALNALAAVDRDCDAAQKMTQEYQKVLTKKADTDKRVAALEKLRLAAHVAAEIAISKTKVTNALKLADPPGHDYAGALSALVGVDAACVTIQKMTEDYQKVLDLKADTDKKIARLESNPQKALIAADIKTIKTQETAALAMADPPGHDYMGATKALGAVDKSCAAAEVKILDKAVSGMSRGDMHDYMEKTFKERFGVKLDMEDKGDSPTDAYKAVRRVYELMAEVPDSHATNNPSLKKIERIGGPGGGANQISYYEPTTDIIFGLGRKASKKVVLHCDRPGQKVTKGIQFGLTNPATGVPDPPVEADCQPRPETVGKQQDYFDWTTLHEIAHGIDDKMGFMNKRGKDPAFGGWAEYGSDCSAAAQAAAAHFNFNTTDAISYIKDLMEGKEGSRPGSKPDAPKGRADWDKARQNVEKWVDSIRVGKEAWEHLPADIGGRIYHEAYEKSWVSYLKANRSQGITGYQYRAPGEWFSELYAAYHSGVLKDSHPMVKKFLKDL